MLNAVNGFDAKMPALLTRVSMRPNAAIPSLMTRSAVAGSVMSPGTTTAGLTLIVDWSHNVKMGRTSDARERILIAGTSLLGQGGYGSVSVADITTAAGVPKGSFYYFFESKQAFALAVIARHWEVQKSQWATALDGAGSPLERLHRLFDATTDTQRAAQRDVGAVTGCLFGNLALELSAQDPLIKLELQRVFDEQISMVEAVVAESIAANESTPTSAAAAARAIVAQLEGFVLFAKLLDDPEQIVQLWPNTLLLLNASLHGAASAA